MAIITIDKKIGLNDFDIFYKRLDNYRQVEAQVDILIPTSLDNDYIGLVVTLFQFLITWVRYPFGGKLMLDVSKIDGEDWDQLFEKEHIYPIVALCINRNGVYDSSGQINIIPQIKSAFDKMHERMVKVKTLKGWKLLLTSADHLPSAQGLLPCFENSDGYIDNESMIGRNLRPALEDILNFSKSARSGYKPFDADFIAIINELMKNTFEWGKTDKQNVPVDPGIRGVFVRFFKRKRPNAVKEFMFHQGLHQYFSNERLQENSIQELYFIEISVFDSGAGFVKKYNERNYGDLSEADIIKRCLIKHRTSATGIEKSEKGIGLDRILLLLDGRGFLRIKTNRSCLYRNLISHPYRTANNERDVELFDWNIHSATSYSTLLNAEGSTITIVYPLAINDRQ